MQRNAQKAIIIYFTEEKEEQLIKYCFHGIFRVECNFGGTFLIEVVLEGEREGEDEREFLGKEVIAGPASI